MKYPVVLRVFAIINLLMFIILLIQSLLFYFEPKDLLFDLTSVFAALWLLITSLVWIFGSRQSYSFIYLTAICLFTLAGATLHLTFVVRDIPREKESFSFLTSYSIIIAVYALMVLSIMLLKPVKKWLTENNLKKIDRIPLISFSLCFLIPAASLLALNKLNPQYIYIESFYSSSSADSGSSPDFIMDLNHLTEFDGILIAKTDQVSELKLVVCYSDNWNTPASATDCFRVDTLFFTPISAGAFTGGLPMAGGSLNSSYLIARMPLVKARRIFVKDFKNQTVFTQSFLFATVHSGNHFEHLSESKFVDSNDGGRPFGNQAVMAPVPQTNLDKVEHSALTEKMRTLLIKSFFETMADDSYASYLFTSRKTIRLKGLNVGMYKEFRNMFDAYGLKSIQAVSSDSGDLLDEALTRLSGLSPYQADETMPFKHVNSTFVEWVERYGLPNTDEEFLGFTTKEIYETVFRRMIWMLAAAHEFVDDGNFDSEAQEYLKRATNSDSTFYALSYLGNRYSERFERGYSSFTKVNEKFKDDMRENYFPFNENIAIGFWLRRRLDGSDIAIWNLVTDILNTYDNYPFEGR